jgi:hypothetical protein
MRAARAASLAELAAMIEAVEHRHAGREPSSIVTGLAEPLDRLACGVLHEWFCEPDAPRENFTAEIAEERERKAASVIFRAQESDSARASPDMGSLSDPCLLSAVSAVHKNPWNTHSRSWTAPLLLFAHLARQCAGESSDSRGGLIVWIGRRLWPQPQALMMHGAADPRPHPRYAALHRTLLVDPPSEDDRLWAIDLCLRSPAVAFVAADAGGLKHAHSRRLQLAAESGKSGGAGGALALLARPVRELAIASAAATRWRIGRLASPTTRPRWMVQLVRCKGVQRCPGM